MNDSGTSHQHEPVALIGIGCRFPGGADDPSLFWQLLRDGVDAVTEIPTERGDPRIFFGLDATSPGQSSARWGGFVRDIDRFDPEFFGISLREAPCIDPQQRLLLETAWEALEDGGEVLDEKIASRTGVFIGISTNDYQQLQANLYDYSLLDVHTVLGCSLSIAANRVSYALNLHGPSIALDTACSSSSSPSTWHAGACGIGNATSPWRAGSMRFFPPVVLSCRCCHRTAVAKPSTPVRMVSSALKEPESFC